MESLLLKNTKYLDSEFQVKSGNILIEDGKISEIMELNVTIAENYKTFDCEGLIVLPGFLNGHFHSGSNSAKGLSQEMGIFEWGNESSQGQIQNILYDQVDKFLSDEEYEIIVLKGLIELLKQGVTSVIDSGFAERSIDPTLNAFKKIGIKGVLDAYDKYPELKDSSCDLINFAAHLDEEEDLSIESIDKAKDVAAKYDPIFLSHSMENTEREEMVYKKFNKSSVAMYSEANLLNNKTYLFHGTKINKEDISIIANNDATLVHCAESNLTTSSGIAPISECLRQGVNVRLGTDWANTQFWELMRLTYMLLKTSSETKEFDAKSVLRMACDNTIAVGCSADLTFVDISDDKFLPLVKTDQFDNYAHNVLMNGSDTQVVNVMVDGKWLIKNKKLTQINEKEVNEQYRAVMTKIFEKKD